MMSDFPLRRIRSFVRRDSRMTEGQQRAFDLFWPRYGLSEKNVIDFTECFQREAPRVLEIGFGTGHSLLEMAKSHPEQDFIGIETHLPGVGSLLSGMEKNNVENIHIFHADAVDVLTNCIPNNSFDVAQIFFPDPWPKRKHHKRRLIQPPFINLLTEKIKKGGTLHLATDWEDYAAHMMNVLSQNPQLINLFGAECYADRSSQRPIITRFEQRALQEKRLLLELQFQKN